MRLTHLLAILVLGLVLSGNLSAQMHSSAKSNPAFDQLKSLVGTWEGKEGSSTPVKVTYQIVSGGSVLMERLQPAKEAEMITMYSLDGDHIVVTHYCSAGNQPTMQTLPVTAVPAKYEFKFVRASGMSSPEEGHMVALTLSMPDKDHLTQVWTFSKDGKAASETFAYTRQQ